MDPALSFNPGSLNFDCLNLPVNNCEEEEAEADAEEREKALQDQLDNELDDGDILDDDQGSFTSELSQHSIMRSGGTFYNDHSRSRMSLKETAFHNGQFASVTSKDSLSTGTDFSNKMYLQHHGYKFSTKTGRGEHSSEEIRREFADGDHYNEGNEKSNEDFPNVITQSINEDVSQQYDYGEHSNSQIASYEVLRNLKEEYRQLQILHQTRGQELEQIKKEEMKIRSTAENDIKFLEHKLSLLQAEKDDLTHGLQQSQHIISEKTHEINELQAKLSTISIQLSAEQEAKENARGMLDSREITIQTLEQQLSNLTRSESFSKLRDQHNRITEDLKVRHKKECLQLKEGIDRLQNKFDSKVKDVENLEYKISQLEQSNIKKSEAFNTLSASLEASQRQCQQLLESGTISEVSIIKLQLQHIEEEKSKIEKENVRLKEEIRSLQWELRCKTESEFQRQESENTGAVHQKTFGKSGKEYSETNVHKELERALKNLRAQRSSNISLKKDLEDTSKQLMFYQEKCKLLEARLTDEKNDVNELEMKLREVSPSGSISRVELESKVVLLQNQIDDLQSNLQETADRLSEVTTLKESLAQLNSKLRHDMATMTKEHEDEIIKAMEESRANCFVLYENAVKKLTKQFSSKAEEEMKRNGMNYDNRIEELQTEIKLLNDQLYEAKTQYVCASDENKSLQSKLEGLQSTASKSREEIEKEIRTEYEKKNNELNDYYLKQSKEYLKTELQKEIDKAQEEWTRQKLEDIKEFVSDTKQHLSEEFTICLEKEREAIQKQLLVEKKNICTMYEDKIKVLKQNFEEERNTLQAQLNKNLESKANEHIQKVNFNHEQEIKKLRELLERKISALEDESSKFKKMIAEQENRHRKEAVALQQEWEKEKAKFSTAEKELRKKLGFNNETELKLSHELKKYQKHVSSISKQLKEESKKMADKVLELEKVKEEKEAELVQLRRNHTNQMVELEEKIIKSKMVSKKSSCCQTEEQMISSAALANIQEVFLACLKQIEEKIKARLLDYRKQAAQRLKQALSQYHNKLVSKIFQDVSDAPLHSPTICISQHSVTRPNAGVQNKRTEQFQSTRFKEQTYQMHQYPCSSAISFSGSGDKPTRQNAQFGNKCYEMMSTPSSDSKEFKKVDFAIPSFFNDISFDFMPMTDTATAPSLFTKASKLSFA